MTYSYFEGLVFLLFSVLILLVIIFDVIGVSLGVFSRMVIFMYALGDSILRGVIPFLRSNIDDRYISRDVMDVYYFNFLIGVFFNKMAFLSVF